MSIWMRFFLLFILTWIGRLLWAEDAAPRVANWIVLGIALFSGWSFESASFLAYSQDPISWGTLLLTLIGSVLVLWNGGIAWRDAQWQVSQPNIVLTAFYTKQVGFYAPPVGAAFGTPLPQQFSGDFLYMDFINDPSRATEASTARELRASIQFYDSFGKALFRMDGRWASHSPQPTTLPFGASIAPLLAVDIGIRERFQLDIACKLHGDTECYGYSNDSYNYQHLQFRNPGHHLGHGRFKAIVQLTGIGVDRQWQIEFENDGTTLKAISSKRVRR